MEEKEKETVMEGQEVQEAQRPEVEEAQAQEAETQEAQEVSGQEPQETPETQQAIQSVTCDECGFIFYPKKLQARREGEQREIEAIFFTCLECQHEYVVCRTNPEIRKMQQKIENLRARIRKPGAHPRVQKARVEELQKLLAEYKQKLDEFNRKGVTGQ